MVPTNGFLDSLYSGLFASPLDNTGSALSNSLRLDSLEMGIVCFSFKLQRVAQCHVETVINQFFVFYDHVLWAGYNIFGKPVTRRQQFLRCYHAIDKPLIQGLSRINKISGKRNFFGPVYSEQA